MVSFRLNRMPVDAEFEKRIPGNAIEISLPGFFYDHLFNRSGYLVGLRYWAMPSTNLAAEPLSAFCEDPRFYFSLEHNFLDMVFFVDEIKNLKCSELESNSAQEFGGDRLFLLDDVPILFFDLDI